MTDEAAAYLRGLGIPQERIDATPPERWYLLAQEHLYLGGPATLTAAQVSEHCGVDAETIRRLWELLGFEGPGDRPVFHESEVSIFRMYADGAAVFGEEPLEHFSRTLGAAARRITDATTALFLEALGDARASASPLEHVQLAVLGGSLLARMPDDVIKPLVLRFAGESQLFSDAAGAVRSPELLVAVGFCDLVGSTVLFSKLDDTVVGRALLEFEARATEVAVRNRGRIVKFVGDEVMFMAVEPADAVAVAEQLVRWVGEHDVLVSARAGVSYGRAVSRGGDLYGSIVHLAARLVDVALPASVVVADDAGPDEVAVRGFDAPVRIRRIDVE